MSRSALATFVGVYLDEELFQAYADEFEAADAFLLEQPSHAATMPLEIDQVLESHPHEGDLATFLAALGMGIDTDGLTYRDWLTQIADRMRTRAATA